MVDNGAFRRHEGELDERKLELVENLGALVQLFGGPALLQVLEPLQDGGEGGRTHLGRLGTDFRGRNPDETNDDGR